MYQRYEDNYAFIPSPLIFTGHDSQPPLNEDEVRGGLISRFKVEGMGCEEVEVI